MIKAVEILTTVREALGTSASRKWETNEEAVHELRKAIKMARALLLLCGAGNARQIRSLARTGRSLSLQRDSDAMLETFEAIREQYPEELSGEGTASIRRALRARKVRFANKAGQASAVLSASRALRRIVKSLRPGTVPDASLAVALHRTERRARKAYRKARKNPLPDVLHGWRKRVKEHWHQLHALNDGAQEGGKRKKHLARLQRLANLLGEDHNVAVLRVTILERPASFGSGTGVQAFLGRAAAYEAALREKALALGKKLHRHHRD